MCPAEYIGESNLKSQRDDNPSTSIPLGDSINVLLHNILRRKFDE